MGEIKLFIAFLTCPNPVYEAVDVPQAGEDVFRDRLRPSLLCEHLVLIRLCRGAPERFGEYIFILYIYIMASVVKF